MRANSDQALAQRLLAIRANGYGYGTFLKQNARRYLFQISLDAVLLIAVAVTGVWVGFAFFLGLALGALLRDPAWVSSTRRMWPFTAKVTNWALVEELAVERPQLDEPLSQS
jgi:hypothetical protein